MAQLEVVSFGNELKDCYKPVDNWVANNITWLEEIQQFYRERSAIEKEYSSKLATLARKYHDKRAKKSSSLSVGDNPALTPGSLEAASITTWTTQLNTLESRAAEHEALSRDLIGQVAQPLEFNQKRFEELRKSHGEYQDKLVKERDVSYADLKKLKTKYDTVCQDLEGKRKKQESAFDKSKAATAYNQQHMDMRNVKNTYLIGINVTNKLKECYYHEYVPELLDSLQDLNETRVAKLNAIWSLAASLETQTLRRSLDHVQHLTDEIPRNNPSLDSTMFVRHNAVQWQDPPDFIFEPSPVWLDSDAMATDESAKVFLRNILTHSKPLAKDMRSKSDQKRRELENVRNARENIRTGKDNRDEVDCVKSQFAVQEELHAIDRERMRAEVETSIITSVAGDLSLYGKSHQFKSETFKIPTNCDFCGDRIWGLSAKGFICTDCGFTCHSKCQMKVPADCPGEQTKEEKKRLKVERQAAASTASAEAPPNPAPISNGSNGLPALTRQNTMNSLSSGYAASASRSVSGLGRSAVSADDQPMSNSTVPAASPPAAVTSTPSSGARKNRIVAPPPVAYVSAGSGNGVVESAAPPGQKRGKMLYAYEARESGEVTIGDGKEVTIMEPDDGGWTKVKTGSGLEGLVPTAYLEELPTIATTLPPSSSNRLSAHERTPSTYSNSSQASSNPAANTGGGNKKKGPAVAPRRGAKKLKYAEAMYSYTAQSDAEFDIEEGEKFVLVSMGSGDGWAEVEKNGVTKSVPANYIKEV